MRRNETGATARSRPDGRGGIWVVRLLCPPRRPKVIKGLSSFCPVRLQSAAPPPSPPFLRAGGHVTGGLSAQELPPTP